MDEVDSILDKPLDKLSKKEKKILKRWIDSKIKFLEDLKKLL